MITGDTQSDRPAPPGSRTRSCQHALVREVQISTPDGIRYIPDDPSGTGVLTLAGSSGRIDQARARLLAGTGAVAEAIRWFGGTDQRPGPHEVPLELFVERIELLGQDCDRVVICGTSFGAEAALLAGAHCAQVDAVIGFAPSDVVWSAVDERGETTSRWTLGGKPLPFVPFSPNWRPDSDPPAFVHLYEESFLEATDDEAEAATIPVERIGDVLLVAGEDDRVWPSLAQAERIATRRRKHGLSTDLVRGPGAGHRTLLPGEPIVTGGAAMERGGTEDADRALGELVMPRIRAMLAPG